VAQQQFQASGENFWIFSAFSSFFSGLTHPMFYTYKYNKANKFNLTLKGGKVMRGKILFISSVTLLFLTTIPHPAYADASAQLKEAGMLVKNRQYEQAEAIYQQIVTAFPDTNEALEAQKQLTCVYIATDRQQEADAAFEKLITGFSKNKNISEAVWLIAKRYNTSKKYEKAIEINQYNVEHFPKDIHAMWSQMNIIRYYISNGNEPAADAAFNKLITIFSQQPTLPEEVWRLAKMYSGLKRNDRAFELYQYNVEHFPKDIHAMWSQMDIIRAYISDGNEPAADAAFNKLLTVFSQQPTLPEEVWRLAKMYSELKRDDKAFEFYQYNVEHFPKDIHAMWSQMDII
jgi:tetratricopeptide (TPR) repeat protein